MTTYRSIAVLLCAAALMACDKNAVQEITGPAPEARIKFFNFGIGAPGVNFYANDTKMSATSSTTGVESVNGVTYGNVSSGGLYSAIAPGQYTLSGRISALTDKDLAISNLATTIEDGKYYSFYQSGVYNTTTKTVDSFIVEDSFIEEPDYTVAYVRFVNASFNSPAVTLYATHTVTSVETAVGGAVAYKSGGEFTALPPGSYNLAARAAGSATNVFSRTAVSFSPGRIYTITARGDITVVSTTAANRPFLDNTLNR